LVNILNFQTLDVSKAQFVFIGTPKNLAKISYNDMSTKFGGRVTADVSKAYSIP
jgi:hypothetical protein